jgi:pyrroline-5-carboxylate reductase
LSDAVPSTCRMLMVGCGAMGGAMLERWLECGLRADRVTVVSPSLRAMPTGVHVVPAIPSASADDGFDLILLALKPQQLPRLAETALGTHAPGLLISILAGVTEAQLQPLCRAGAVVRAMPNLPVRLGKGVVGLTSHSASATTREVVSELMRPLGLVEWVDEDRFDLVTALAGSGPAFLYRFVDALAAAAVARGMPQDSADRLALATVEGAAALASQSDLSPAALADRVASPAGSTREGLNVLDQENALKRLLHRTLAASERRNRELAAIAAGEGNA